jgi:hypothetical protein
VTTQSSISWEPVPWEAHQRHAWPSQWQKDAGTYLIPKAGFTDTNYHTDVCITRLPCADNWDNIDAFSDFDLSWHPDPADPAYIYQFGTQHQKTGGPLYCMPGATNTKYVSQIKVNASRVASAVYLIDHTDNNLNYTKQAIEQSTPVTKIIRYFDNYLDTLRRLARNIPDEHEFVWVCSSICDYSNFDFTWHPEQWQVGMLHVFASESEKFGDTFFMHVPSFKNNADKCQLLDWYDLHFVSGIAVPRHPLPVIKHNFDSHVDAIQSSTFNGPLALFTASEVPVRVPAIPLWREKTKTITPLTSGASSVVIPKAAIPYIKKQLYDYPYIDKLHCQVIDSPIDIMFISNGESNAELNWGHLTHGIALRRDPNRIVRINGINGRAAAYKAAASASQTPWFFAVFAKLEVDLDFDWSWQPDRMQQPKHYIFHAKNPVNGLEYGHQAMIAYNKALVLANQAKGLDFTLDQEHEVVPLLSGVARYNDSAWTCWRTAFREVLKLKHSEPDIETEYRLTQWLTVGNGKHGQWSVLGALDAVEYYDSVQGSFDELKKSYEWDWLASYALMKRNLLPSQ